MRLLETLPPHRRLWLVRRLTRLPLSPARSPVGSLRRVRDGGRRVRARVVADATPLDVWHRNLREVTQVLDSAGVPYFCVRAGDSLRSAVAVPSARQEEVLRLLRGAPLLAGAYVRTADPGVVRVFRPVTNTAGSLVLGSAYACEVEFWRDQRVSPDGPAEIVAPRANRVASVMPTGDPAVRAPAWLFSHLVPHRPDVPSYRTRPEFARVGPEHVTFPIDAVYTWVDGSDPHWQQRKNAALAGHGDKQISEIAANASRYLNRDELRYSLRSLVCFAPWIRHIYLVTDDQVPPWLDPSHEMITVVPHREIFGGAGTLPTFNSHAIESRLHHIPGLAEHFVYLNDDMFVGRPVPPTTFFHANGIGKFFLSPAQLEVGPATLRDAPVTAAGKNNRRHIADRFGKTITQKMRHVPYALRKSVLAEIEETLPVEALATASHQFRHPEDLSIPSSLHHYWSFLSGRAVPGMIRYTYADLAHPSTPVRLAFLLSRRHCDVFCLNDTDSDEVSLTEQHAMLAEFLPAYFPFRAPFELPDEVVARRSAFSATELAAMSIAPVGAG